MINRRTTAASRHALKKAALAAGCSLSLSTLLGTVALAAGKTPPPCAVDGVCIPNAEVWGVYRTSWRPWPGEQVGPTPTPSDEGKKKGTPAEEENLGDFELPEPSREGESEPPSSKKKRVAPNANAPTDPNAAGDNQEMPEGLTRPRTNNRAPAPPAPGNATTQFPESDPFGQPFEPQGAVPATNQPKLTSSVQATSRPTVPQPAKHPSAKPQSAIQENPRSATRGAAPKDHDADAPPALPESLMRLTHGGRRRELRAQQTPPPAVHTNRYVNPTSAEGPAGGPASSGIRLINPAAALAVEPGASGLQPAVYYEATDATVTDAE